MRNRKKFIRIVALVLAILMLGSVIVVALQAIAMSPESMAMIPNTGDGNTKTIIIVVAVVAVLALLGVTVVPAIVKKKG